MVARPGRDPRDRGRARRRNAKGLRQRIRGEGWRARLNSGRLLRVQWYCGDARIIHESIQTIQDDPYIPVLQAVSEEEEL